MELNAINHLRRTAVRTLDMKTAVPAANGSVSSKPKTDSIALTKQSVDALKEQNQRLMALLRQDREPESPPALLEMLEPSGEAESDMLDAMGEKLKVMMRCQKIAARIMRGDKVPPQDEQYLMQNDPDGYKMAIAMRTPKKKPKEWKSVLEEEEKKTEENSGGESTQETSQTVEGASGSEGDTGSDSGE